MSEQPQEQHQEQHHGHPFWEGVKKFCSSGFGKGMLITAALAITAFAFTGGTMGALDKLWLFDTPTTAVKATFTSGLTSGVSHAFKLIFSIPGLIMLSAGGLAGFAYQKSAEAHNCPDPRVAQLALELERERAKSLQPTISVAQNQNHSQAKPEPAKETNFCAAETKRRTDMQAAAQCKAI